MYVDLENVCTPEGYIMENLLLLLSSRVPANVYLGIIIGQNYIPELDQLFSSNFTEFCEQYEGILGAENIINLTPNPREVNLCYHIHRLPIYIISTSERTKRIDAQRIK